MAGVHLSGPGLRAPVTSAEHVMALLGAGNLRRAVGATHCNAHSSRSHAILTLYVESRAGLHSAAEVVKKKRPCAAAQRHHSRKTLHRRSQLQIPSRSPSSIPTTTTTTTITGGPL